MEKSKKVLFVIVIVLAMFLIGVLGFKIAQNKYKPNDNDVVVGNNEKVANYIPLEELAPANGSLDFSSILENKYYVLIDNEIVYNADEVDRFLNNVNNNIPDVIRICCYERQSLNVVKDVEFTGDKFIIRTDNRWNATVDKEDRKIVVNEYDASVSKLYNNSMITEIDDIRSFYTIKLLTTDIFETVDLFDYFIVDTKEENEFELEFIKNDTGERKLLLSKNEMSNVEYDSYLYSCDVNVIIKGKKYELRDALLSGKITIEQIVNEAEKDEEENKIILGGYYLDGGSAEYYYEDYTILKFNTLAIPPKERNKDLYIGSPKMHINEINNLYYK